MRYAIIPRGISVGDVEAEILKAGGTNIAVKPMVRQVYCDLDPEQAKALALNPNIAVKAVTEVSTDQMVTSPDLETPDIELPSTDPAFKESCLMLNAVYQSLIIAYTEGITGVGLTVAVLDSGVRATHVSLVGKVILNEDYSGGGNPTDLYGHGTGIASIIVGDYGDEPREAPAPPQFGIATGAKIMNMKVLNDTGTGTEEWVVDAIERVCALVAEAQQAGLPLTDPMYPNTINLSLGSEDDGDYNNPMRAACRVAVNEYQISVLAAAGNGGPLPRTILSPAVDDAVLAIGSLHNLEDMIMESSARGPTLEGLTKPDYVAWGQFVLVADHESDDGWVRKSGTSFAVPILAGADGLLWELARNVHGQDVRISWYDWIPTGTTYTTKPEGAPTEKDNTYGYGLPNLGAMMEQIARPVVSPTSIMADVIPMMIVMMMMVMMTKVIK